MRIILLAFGMMTFMSQFAQEHSEETHHYSDESKKHHQIGLLIGHTHISQGIQEGKRRWKVLPAFGINYNYWINDKWAIGLHTDIVLDTYEVERYLDGGSEEIIERETPIAPALIIAYKPFEHISFLVGPGYEIEKEENLEFVRLEAEYNIEITHHLEFEAGLGCDFRINVYNSWSLVAGLSYAF